VRYLGKSGKSSARERCSAKELTTKTRTTISSIAFFGSAAYCADRWERRGRDGIERETTKPERLGATSRPVSPDVCSASLAEGGGSTGAGERESKLLVSSVKSPRRIHFRIRTSDSNERICRLDVFKRREKQHH